MIYETYEFKRIVIGDQADEAAILTAEGACRWDYIESYQFPGGTRTKRYLMRRTIYWDTETVGRVGPLELTPNQTIGTDTGDVDRDLVEQTTEP